jgi:predicted nucleotidyltransferase
VPLAGRLCGAFIFGSAARGEFHASSDIDLLVVGEASLGDVGMAVREAEKRLGRDVNPTVYSLDEFQATVRAKQHFLTTVLAEPKIFVLGGESDLGDLVTKRTAAGTAGQSKRHPQSTRTRPVRRRRQRD